MPERHDMIYPKFEPTVTFGNLLQVVVIIAGGATALVTMANVVSDLRADNKVQDERIASIQNGLDDLPDLRTLVIQNQQIIASMRETVNQAKAEREQIIRRVDQLRDSLTVWQNLNRQQVQ